MFGINPYTPSDALACIAAAKVLLNHGHASEANRTSVEYQIVSIFTLAAPYLL
jgi:hypothetical protein